MTGSVALDVVIGLVFIYLLYSLLGTILCEIIALHLGLRARNLQQAIRRMLEDSPQVSEIKIVAFAKNMWHNLLNQFHPKEGPGTCVFYHLPSIKYLGRNTYYSKPSYITRQNFSKAIIEIFRRYGGTDDMPELEKIQNVLKGALKYPGVLNDIKEEIVTQTKVDPAKLDQTINYTALRDSIQEMVNADSLELLDEAQRKLFGRIKKMLSSKRTEKKDKAVVYQIDEMLNLFGHETRSHLTSLLKDANNDLVKFKLYLEQWFDDTMDRATGWYKQKVQFVLLIVGFALALFFNADTLVIVKKLSVDTDARDKLVAMANNYVSDPTNKLPEKVTTVIAKDSALVDSLKMERLKELKKVQQTLQRQMDEANTILGIGWLDLPDSLPLMRINKEDSLSKLAKRGLIDYTKVKVVINKKDSTMLLIHTGYLSTGIRSCLAEKNTFFWEDNIYVEAKTERRKAKIYVESGIIGNFEYYIGIIFANTVWGYLLTALAISLGAPFWFDMLNKLVQIRGAIKEPTKTKSGEEPVAAASTGNPAHTINRKG